MKKSKSLGKIIVTGHPYAFPHYFRVFEYATDRNQFVFILPKLWLAKAGKIRIKLESKSGFTIFGLKAMSYGGRLIGGLFKGWMPGVFFLLPYLKIKYRSKVLYSCSEPNLLTTLYNGLIAKVCGLKYVIFTWQNVAPEIRMSGLKLKLSNALVHLNFRLADGIICGNQKAAKIVSSFQFPVSRTIICPIAGVDMEKFRPEIISNWKQKLGLLPDEKLILFYGALDSRKGLNILIEVFKMLITNYQLPITRLVIVGTGSQKEELAALAGKLDIEERVIFLDWMRNDELPALLNSADVFVYPSVPSGGWEEQFGYAMAEASACGVPVVATRTGSIDEIVRHNESGILVEPNNPEQLAVAIGKILSDSKLARQMGEYGREYVVRNFSHSIIAVKITNFLRSFQK